VFARNTGFDALPISERVETVLAKERTAGLDRIETYRGFGERVTAVRQRFVGLLRDLKRSGAKVAAYGAPAKGNTLLNFCGINADLIAFTVDRNPAKQNHFLPGSHIPIHAPDRIAAEKPDYVVILPWNLQEEIMTQLAEIRQWGGRFIVPIPEPRILP
jgi:hypothetical protein